MGCATRFTPHAQRDMLRIPRPDALRILYRLTESQKAMDPGDTTALDAKDLQGHGARWRLRAGDCRVVHTVEDGRLREATVGLYAGQMKLTPDQQAVNCAHAGIRALGEPAMTALRTWRLPCKLRCSTNPHHQPCSGRPRPSSDLLKPRWETARCAERREQWKRECRSAAQTSDA